MIINFKFLNCFLTFKVTVEHIDGGRRNSTSSENVRSAIVNVCVVFILSGHGDCYRKTRKLRSKEERED